MGFCDKTVFHLMSNNMYINRMSRESLGLVVKYPSVYLLSVNRHNTLSFLGINKIFLIRLNVFILSFLRNHINSSQCTYLTSVNYKKYYLQIKQNPLSISKKTAEFIVSSWYTSKSYSYLTVTDKL